MRITPAWVAVAKWAVQAALVALPVYASYYPGQKWPYVVFAVLGTLGLHVIPSSVQAMQAMQAMRKP